MGREGGQCFCQIGEPAGVILALPADDGYGVIGLVGDHAVAVHLLLVHPALVVEGLSDKGRLHEGNGGEGHNLILPSGASGLLFWRPDRMRDAGATVTGHPDALTVHTAV